MPLALASVVVALCVCAMTPLDARAQINTETLDGTEYLVTRQENSTSYQSSPAGWTVAYTASGLATRGSVAFTIPSGRVVTAAMVRLRSTSQSGDPATGFTIYDTSGTSPGYLITANQGLFDDLGGGTAYSTPQTVGSGDTEITLNASAVSAINSAAGSGFAIGLAANLSGEYQVCCGQVELVLTYLPLPVVTGLSPALSGVTGGDFVDITGVNFTGATGVSFGAVPSPTFSVVSDTLISAAVPAGSGVVDVSVTGPGGSSPTGGASDDFTYIATPQITGTNVIGNDVSISFDLFGASGECSLDGGAFAPCVSAALFTGLAEGSHTFSVRGVVAGVPGTPASLTFVVDTVAPASAVLTPSEGSTTGPRPFFSGTAEPSAEIQLLIDGVLRGVTNATPEGEWSFDSIDLAEGSYTVQVIATDAVTNSAFSNTNTFTVDTVAPAAPLVFSPPDGSMEGPLVSIFGRAEAFASVQVIIDGTPRGTTFADSDGLWLFAPEALADGVHTVRAIATDAAGNISPSSSTNTFTVDATAPAAPVVTSPLNGSASTIRRPTITGTAEANATVQVFVDGNAIGTTTVSAGGSWSLTLVTDLNQGTHTVRAIATDAAGNSSPTSSTISFFVLALPPVVADTTVSVPYESPGTEIDLTASITGLSTGIAIETLPANGTVSVTGYVVTYTPTRGYFGQDSFTVAAVFGGETSGPATVSVTVEPPPPPTATPIANVAVAYNSSGQSITLQPTGLFNAVQVATAPTNGTATVVAGVATYIPDTDYFGPDSFTYTATGPGGTSAPATVSLIVGPPDAPTVTAVRFVVVDYNSAGRAIALQPAGVFTSVQVATSPTNGTVTIDGTTATYVPTSGYFGPDSFTYTATGPGGTSAPATVEVSVANPPPPVVTPPPPVTTQPATDGPGVALVDLNLQSSGVIFGFSIATPPRNGVAQIVSAPTTVPDAEAAPSEASGNAVVRSILRYVPNAGFLGVDEVAVFAFGPGGDSPPTVFTFNVPGRAPDLSGTVASNGSISFSPTDGLTGGPFQGLRITGQPAFGEAVVSGTTLTFTPGLANGGVATIDYVVVLAFGESQAGRITITSNLAPASQALTATTVQGVPVTVRISDNVQGGPFTAAQVVSVVQSASGTAAITANGSGAGQTYDLTFTPSGAFQGQAVVTYTLSNGVASATSTLTVTVQPRPDPSLDPEVRGVASGQMTSARRFADTQMNNIQRRLESLHDGTNETDNGLSLNLGFGQDTDGSDARRALRQRLGSSQNDPGAISERDHDQDRALLARQVWGDRVAADGSLTPALDRDRANAGPSAVASDGSGSPVGLWAAGSVDWGRTDASGQRDYRFTTQGLTVGLDRKVTDRLIVGGGLGYAHDRTRIGDNGSLTRGEGVTGALYASYRPAENYYVDGIVGYGQLDFESRRWTTGLGGQGDGYALGERSGDLLFSSLALGRTASTGDGRRTFYVRLDARQIELDAFTETGAGLSNLTWSALKQDSLSAALGGAWSWSHDLDEHGVVIPSVRVEWSHELEGSTDQGVRYADWASSPLYLVSLEGWARNNLRLDGGLEWRVGETQLGLGYRGSFSDTTTSHGGELRLKWEW